MQISALNFNRVNATGYKNNSVSVFQKYNACDCVSFTRRPDISNCIGDNSKKGIELGKDLLKDLLDGKSRYVAIQKIAKNYPDINCKPIERLKEVRPSDYQNYGAMYTYRISDNFHPDSPMMYVDINGKRKNQHSDYLFTSEVAHEYTHLSQSCDSEYINEMKKISGDNKSYAEFLEAMAECIFSYYDNQFQAQTVLPSFQPQDKMNTARYSGFIPREVNITKQSILKKANYQYESMFNRDINKYFDLTFENLCSIIPYQDDENMPRELKDIYYKMSENGELEKFKSDIKKICKMLAKKEKEAYATESELAREYIHTSESINLDAFPLYYDMLENALN